MFLDLSAWCGLIYLTFNVHDYSSLAFYLSWLGPTGVSAESERVLVWWEWLYRLPPFLPHIFPARLSRIVVRGTVLLLPGWCDRQLPLQPQYLLLRLPKKLLKFQSTRWNRGALHTHINIHRKQIISLALFVFLYSFQTAAQALT